jgi:hypothetical protein
VFKRSVILILALAVVTLAGLHVRNQNSAPQPKSVAQAEPSKPASAPSSAPAPTEGKPWVAMPMPSPASATPKAPAAPPRPRLTLADISQPPEGTPVKDVLTQLREAADQGIPQAACHVGVELLRCARLGNSLIALGDAQAAAGAAQPNTPEGQRLMRESMAAARSVGNDQRTCGDVPQELTREAWRYVYAAAAAGNVAAMSRFVRDPGMDNTGSTQTEEGWAAYERDAKQFLGEAIKAGDVRALYHAWLVASGSNAARGTKVFRREPDYAIAYGEALRGLFDSWTDRRIQQATLKIAAEVGRERAEAAQREGGRLKEMYFAAATPIDKGNDDSVTNVADCWK